MLSKQRFTVRIADVSAVAIVLITTFTVPSVRAQQTEQPVTNQDPRYFVYMRGIT